MKLVHLFTKEGNIRMKHICSTNQKSYMSINRQYNSIINFQLNEKPLELNHQHLTSKNQTRNLHLIELLNNQNIHNSNTIDAPQF